MTGTVNIARNLFDHAVFMPEPLTEREAWVWLIMEASWKPRTRRMGNAVIDTQRGELAASVRFMATAWKWAPAKVQRYLKRLEKMEMIRSKTDTGVSVVTICNYDDYQYGDKDADTAPIQQRYSSDTNEKKGRRKEGKEKDAKASSVSAADSELPTDPDARLAKLATLPPVGPTPSKPADPVVEAVDAYTEAAQRQGWRTIAKITPNRRSAIKARLKEAGGVEGWRIAIEKCAASDFLGQASPFQTFGLDWIANPQNFTKIMEGNYDDQRQQPARQDRRAAAADDALRQRIEGAVRNRNPSGDGISFD